MFKGSFFRGLDIADRKVRVVAEEVLDALLWLASESILWLVGRQGGKGQVAVCASQLQQGNDLAGETSVWWGWG